MKRSGRLTRRTPLRSESRLERGTGLERGGPIAPVNPKRRKAERERAYGPQERREWLKRQPCIICGRLPVDQAHVETGGTGRKADADKVVPLCSGPEGHHWEHHRGAKTFEARYRIDLQADARRIDRLWREHLKSEAGDA